MNWQMLGALGEIFGALAVIATLVYLAKQVGESTRASRQAAYEERKHLLSDEFRAALEEDIASSPGYRPAGFDPDEVLSLSARSSTP